jgi:hypothetical protein
VQHCRSVTVSADWPSGVSGNESSASSSARPQLRLRLGGPAAASYADLAARLGPRALVCQTVPAATELVLGIVSEPELARSSWSERRVLVDLLADHAVALPPVSVRLAADMVAGLRG